MTTPLMRLNATKAGMGNLDESKINSIIHEASKDSKFFAAKSRRQVRIDAQKWELQRRMSKVAPSQVKESERSCDNYIALLERHHRALNRVVVHIDMDAFYASVEMRDEPKLKDIPMAVGSNSMLSTSNYKARLYGVRAGMPGFIGKKLCPNLLIVPTNFDKYREVADVIRQIFAIYDPDFEAVSLDEAYLDITDYLVTNKSGRRGENADNISSEINTSTSTTHSNSAAHTDAALTTPSIHVSTASTHACADDDLSAVDNVTRAHVEQVVNELRSEVRRVTNGLTCSAGIAPNCLLAKICSDMNKPDGQYYLTPNKDAVIDFMAKLPIRKVGGIGAVSEQLLSSLDINTCGHLYAKRGLLRLLFSKISSEWFIRVSLGVDVSSRNEGQQRERKSIGTETTIKDTSDMQQLRAIVSQLSNEVSEDLLKRHLRARKVTIKLKTTDFDIKTITASLNQATNDASTIADSAIRMLDKYSDEETLNGRTVNLRLVGVRMTHLEALKGGQKTLFDCFKGNGNSNSTNNEAPDVFFECPVCESRVAAVNETDFQTRHLDSCLSGRGEQVDHDDEENDDGDNRVPDNVDNESISEVMLNTTSTTTTTTETTGSESSTAYVRCPICMSQKRLEDINTHLDHCLNREALAEASSDTGIGSAVESNCNRSGISVNGHSKRRKVSKKNGMKSIDSFFSRKTTN